MKIVVCDPGILLIKNANVVRKIEMDEIFYIESANRKVILHLRNEDVEHYGKIGELEIELAGEFFRIHKGYLVNMKHVEKYERNQLYLKSGKTLMISKYRFGDFVNAYLEYIR